MHEDLAKYTSPSKCFVLFNTWACLEVQKVKFGYNRNSHFKVKFGGQAVVREALTRLSNNMYH